MRLVGPNCLGVLNTAPGRAQRDLRPAVAAGGQRRLRHPERRARAGADRHRRRRGLGLSSFASVGNKADISGNDLLQYWEDDERTDVALLYLESFGNPRRFARIARRVGRKQADRRGQERPLPGGRARHLAPIPARCSPPRTSPSTRSSRRPA